MSLCLFFAVAPGLLFMPHCMHAYSEQTGKKPSCTSAILDLNNQEVESAVPHQPIHL